jgi:hypothetical protein
VMQLRSRVRRASRRAGQTLVIALIVLGVLLSIGLVFLAIIAHNVNQTTFNRQQSVASNLSRAGIRFAHRMLLFSVLGADWRPDPTVPIPVVGSPNVSRDPDILYLRPGSGLGLRSDTDPQKDLGGPDGQGAFTRLEFPNGRALVRVRYAPSDANIFSSEPTGPLRNPGRARDYTVIECVGRPGKISFNDPTSGNSGTAIQFQNYATSTDFRNALALMKKVDAQIIQTSKTIAFASIGIIESAEYITNQFKLSRAAEFGIPSELGVIFNNVDITTGKDITTSAQKSPPLAKVFGDDLPLYNFGNPPTPTASPVGLGGAIFANADLKINGLLDLKLNAQLGDIVATNGIIYGSTDDATIRVESNATDPTTGQWLAPVITDLQNGTTPSLRSRSTSFSTVKGDLRDGVSSTDVDGYQRGVGTKDPPSMFAVDPDTGMSRAILGTRESGKLIGGGKDSRFGYGDGVYVNNFGDRQTPADESGRAQVGTSQSLTYDWLNPNNGQSSSGWQGPFYVPRGAYMLLVTDGFYITRDSRASASEKFWAGADGNPPNDLSGNPVQTGTVRFRIGVGADGFNHIINTFTPDPTATSQSIDINASSPNYDAGPIFNGLVYFEGNVRVRGIIATDIQMTVVSGATIYVEGSITKGVDINDNNGLRLQRPSKSMLMLIAHDYVTLNTTQFLGPSVSQALEVVNDSQSEISFNPVRMRVGGDSLRFTMEEPLDPLTPGGNPTDPSTWRPFALDYQTSDTSFSPAAMPQNLLLAHTMDDGPAPASYISVDVNFSLDNTATTFASSDPDWVYRFLLSNNNAASQPYFDFNGALTSANSEPIYGLGVEPWQRYSRFESIAFPLVESDFTWATSETSPNPNFVMEGNFDPTSATPIDREGSYVLKTGASNEIRFSHNNVGSDPTNDYLLARAAAVPSDVRIEASMFAENGSFFVIPGPPFNPNPNDRRDVFNAAVTGYGGAASTSAIQQAQQDRLDNFGTSPQTPFYGEPLDVRIIIIGAISENMPASIDEQAQWIKKWGWIPAQEAAEYDFTGGTPRPVLIPKSHVPAGYNINPSSPNPSMYVPNLIVTYDPVLATGKLNGFDTALTNLDIREDKFGRTLPPLPRLPVSPTLAYFGEVNP